MMAVGSGPEERGDCTLALRYLFSPKWGKVMLVVGTCFANTRWIMCGNVCLLLGDLG